MNYIIQINTGNLKNKKYDTKTIIEKLDKITSKINISKAIIGWYPDKIQNKEIITYLKNKNIESYFWLPVFAEIIDKDIEDNNVSSNLFNEYANTFTKNDKFDFVCQSSNKNIDYIINEFNKITGGLDIDGVFLDRIRYQSPTVNKNAILGCLCDECMKIYQKNKIDINKFDEHIFDNIKPIKLVDGVYSYNDDNFNKLMEVKRDIITQKIEKLYRYFKSKNLKVGLDAFALCLADFVGQDIVKLANYSDFIKPMFYLKTLAPAGVPYELKGLGHMENEVNNLWNIDVCEIKSTIKQIKYLEKYNINITPGIDVNNIKGICESNKSYVVDYINQIKETNTKEIVLSWDALLIDDEILDMIKEK